MKRCLVISFLFLMFFPFNVKANIMCNDGTRSPSCADCHRGCCSHHGGCASGGSSSNYSSIPSYVFGCTNANAINYNPGANRDDGSCISKKYGCMDASAINYDSSANISDESCKYRKEVKEIESIPYEKEYEETDELYVDDEKVKTEGKKGSKEITYEVIIDKYGKELEKKKIGEKIIIEPINEIVLKGTKEYSNIVVPATGVLAIGTAIYTVKKKMK